MEYFEHETIEGCNCINCRMARMESNMAEIHVKVSELVSALQNSPIIRSN